jgi:thiosulfate/3-mercaptopyruvate sulfurtransferase
VGRIWYAGWQDGHLGNVPDELVAVRTRESLDARAARRVGDTWVAEVDGEVVGFVMVDGDEVDQVYVDRDHRGSGLAETLLAAAERHVLRNGHTRAWLAVVPGNARARRFYERRGWRDEGGYDHPAPVDGGHVIVPARRYVKDVSPLVGAADLAARLGEVSVLDVRYRTGAPAGRGEYDHGHVPGAAYVDLDAELAGPPGAGGRHPLPEPSHFEGAMRRAGVCGHRPVVVYDDWAGHAAARAWWLLRHHGHGDVRVLDGGWAAWRDAGLPVATEQPSPAPGDFTCRPGVMPLVEAADVPAVGVLVDARAPERWRGDTEPIDPVAGRIPGAVNVPTTANLDDRGRFRSPVELRALYGGVGAVPTADVTAYCGSGVTACHDVLAMEVAGVGAALYPGSWSGWITDRTRPVEVG